MPTHTAACAYDGWYTYTAANGREGRCYAQVWQPRAGIPVVIVTEPADNPGPSVTNATEALATQLWHALLPQSHEGFRLIEVYLDTANAARGAERLAEVSYTLRGDRLASARYRHTTRAQVEALIGGPFSAPFESSY